MLHTLYSAISAPCVKVFKWSRSIGQCTVQYCIIVLLVHSYSLQIKIQYATVANSTGTVAFFPPSYFYSDPTRYIEVLSLRCWVSPQGWVPGSVGQPRGVFKIRAPPPGIPGGLGDWAVGDTT